ncbi:MAG: siroheme synthase CysG [Brevundimonas sp.]|uniref:siroheme synthase CysG n=1 Tax=Brevundimonas sp. TaxID=1871086 RepID=UPI004034BDCC
MRVFLASIPMDDARVVVVGDGEAALAKLRLFGKTPADLVWFAPNGAPTGPGALQGGPEAIVRVPTAEDLRGARLVFVAVDDADLAVELAALARAAGAQVNVVDRPALSDFHTPALIDRDEVVIGVATGGSAPILARDVRSRIEAVLPAGLTQVAKLARDLRETVIASVPDFMARRRFWEKAFRGPAADLAASGRPAEARREMLRLLNVAAPEQGVVHIVGAGPGDPELLTLKALRVLQDADVIIHDKLVPEAILDRARRDAHRLYVGKSRSNHSVPQDQIETLMVEEARKGQRVVRLKGGDPFVFGRGGEELEAMRRAGVPVFVVPGITAALGCAASAGIPLTHRDHAQSVTFVTAQEKPGGVAPDWSRLAGPNQTLAIYMGAGRAAETAARLIEAGRDPQTPVAIVENGSRPDERVINGALADLGDLVARAHLTGPALLFVGECAAFSAAELDVRAELVA